MLKNTRGIVLRSVKYGETSLVCTVFTEVFGVQSYIIKGVRSSKAKTSKAGLFQPGTLLELVAYQKSQQNLQFIKELQPFYIYGNLQEEVVKNSICLFSVEVLFRLLPEHAPLPELFQFCINYFINLDKLPTQEIPNFPVYFIMECSRLLGYNISGLYTEETPYLNLQDGAFTHIPPPKNLLNEEDSKKLSAVLEVEALEALKTIEMNAICRHRILEWYIEFLQTHTQHLGNIKSLAVLQAILH